MTVYAAGGVFGMCGLVNATVRRDFVFLPTKSVTTDAPRALPLTLLEVANQELTAPVSTWYLDISFVLATLHTTSTHMITIYS